MNSTSLIGPRTDKKKRPFTYWIIGGGKFGLKSAVAMRKRQPEADIVVVDTDVEVCRQLEKLLFRTVCMDGVEFMDENLVGSGFPDWIIPVIPVHVTYEWIAARLTLKRKIEVVPVPGPVIDQIPNPMPGPAGETFVSIADFLCPENCPEPSGICTHTGKSRPYRLFDKLAGIRYEDIPSIVVRSHQLSPGVGGFRPAALFEALEAVESKVGPVLLSTACRCHGIIHAFRISPPLSFLEN